MDIRIIVINIAVNEMTITIETMTNIRQELVVRIWMLKEEDTRRVMDQV